MVLNMALLFNIFFLFVHFLTVSSQNTAEILTVHSKSNNNAPASIAVSVNNQDLTQVATSVLTAETWLRTHVLTYYPAFNITHIVIGHNLLCSSQTHHHFHHLILPALENFHHSLIRWGLHSVIKVSPSLSSHCLDLDHDFTHSFLPPLVEFIKYTNSSYMINPSSETHKIETVVKTLLDFLKKNGFSTLESDNMLNVLSPLSQDQKPTMRKLSYVPPTTSLPPLVGVGPTISPPSPIPGTPHVGLSPLYSPHPHHHHNPHYLPPCNPAPAPPQAAAPGPVAEPKREKLWCVAKPSVPAETLQEGMDYACGEGGAECDEIQPEGNCYYPDTIVSHASYAYNNYWQKTKLNGGTCSFGGTAMLINSDPSFLQCKFIVS